MLKSRHTSELLEEFAFKLSTSVSYDVERYSEACDPSIQEGYCYRLCGCFD